MHQLLRPALVLCLLVAPLVAPTPSRAAQQIHRCHINGTVTYQGDPCPGGDRRPMPSAQQLNAERQRRIRQATDSAAPASAPVPTATGRRQPASVPVPAPAPMAMQPAASRPGGFRCDGRQFCSQMTSCAEATYFLTHCPGTHMDGDHDGVPCERQWCAPPR